MGLQLGNKNIPILQHVSYPRVQPSRHHLQVAWALTPTERYNKGVRVGVTVNPSAQTVPSPGAPSSYPDILSGRAPLNGAELVFAVSEKPTTSSYPAPEYDGEGLISYVNDQQQTIQLDSSQIVLAVGQAQNFTLSRFYEVRAYAISYDYPDANTDEGKRKGYVVFTCYHLIERNASGDYIGEGYQEYPDYLFIDIPYYNTQYGLDLSYDEVEPTPEPEPDTPFDPSSPTPYNPTFDDSSDQIDIPPNPTIGITSAGFINVYNPGLRALRGLGDIIFPDVANASDTITAILTVCEAISNQNLINYVIDCHVIPVTPQTGNNENIKVGFRNTGIPVPAVTSDYVDVSCGSLNIAEFFSGFQDYLYTFSKLFLPFIGYVDVKPEYWQSGTIYVDYKFNIIDGSFMCYIRSTSSKSNLNASVIAQYSGVACCHFPITGVNYASMISGVIGSVVSASHSQNSSGYETAYSIANTVAQGGDTQQSNGYNASNALLSVRYPYLIIERPSPSVPSTYRHDKGAPCNISAYLSGISGYTEIENIDLSGIPFTDGELNELRQLLSEGVYF